MAGKTIVSDSRVLSFDLVDPEYRYINNSDIINFALYDTSYAYTMKSTTVLSFMLEDFDETIPVYVIVLDFMNSSGGIY